MATRYSCDHCGNIISSQLSIRRFWYGEYNPNYATTLHPAFGAGGNGQHQHVIQPPSIYANTGQASVYPQTYPACETVELCQTCASIWPKRVAALCDQSRPECSPSTK